MRESYGETAEESKMRVRDWNALKVGDRGSLVYDWVNVRDVRAQPGALSRVIEPQPTIEPVSP